MVSLHPFRIWSTCASYIPENTSLEVVGEQLIERAKSWVLNVIQMEVPTVDISR